MLPEQSPTPLAGFDARLRAVDAIEDAEIIPPTPEESSPTCKEIPVVPTAGNLFTSCKVKPNRGRSLSKLSDRRTRSQTRPRINATSDEADTDQIVVADIHSSATDDDISTRLPLAKDSVLLHRGELDPTSVRTADALGLSSWSVTEEEDDHDSTETVVPNSEMSSDDEYHDVSPVVKNIIQNIFSMDPPTTPTDGAAINRYDEQLKTYILCSTVYSEEFEDLVPSEIADSELPKLIDQARDMKDKLLKAQVDSMNATEMEISRETKAAGAAARAGFVNFVKLAVKELKTVESRNNTPAPLSLNTSSSSSATSNQAKTARVEKYTESTVDQMRQMIDTLEALSLDQPTNQVEFRNLQDRIKRAQKELAIVKKNADKLMNYADECNMIQEGEKLEDVYRTMEAKEVDLDKDFQSLKEEYGITGEQNGKNSDIKCPHFSGDSSDKTDYYSFKEEWDEYISVKAPSRAEQLRILLRTSLTGTARAACRHMTSVDEIFDHLRENFGIVSDLIFNLVEELRRLGTCSGSNDKKRKWAVEVKSQLNHLTNLSQKHGIYETLYNHPVIAELQEKLPYEILQKFIKRLRKQLPGGRAHKKVVFETFLEYLDEVVAIFTFNHTYKMDCGVDTDKYSRSKVDVKPAPGTNKPPAPKTKTFSSTTTPGTGKPVTKPNPGATKNQNAVRVTSSYTSPEMKPCGSCKGQHTHAFYCEDYYKASIQTERVRVAIKMQTCFRCLRLDCGIDFSDRERWEKNHAVNCQSEWVCNVEVCAKRSRNKQYHFTLCKWHEAENKKKQGDFIKVLDRNQIKPGVSFFFNTPHNYNLNLSKPQRNLGDYDKDVVDDVHEPSIFMLQEVVVNERNLLLFYDSGCLGSALSDRAADILNSTCVREGPTTMNVAGGKTVILEGGDEQFLLDLAIPGKKALITGLKMPHVTTPFPLWNISQAWKQICSEYAAAEPNGKPLPPVTDRIGGVEVDIIIGIRYQKHFPELICNLPCGLGIFKSKIKAPRGELTVLGGPHPAWRYAADMVGFMGANSFFTAEARAFRDQSCTLKHIYHPVQHEDDDLLADVVLEELLELDQPCVEQCLTVHCDKHGDLDNWIIPADWDIENSIYSLRQTASRFAEAELVGSEVTYRCVRCRNCAKCKQGESLESASLREEQEQYVIEQSVIFDEQKGRLVAKLPFMADPGVNLKPNRYTAERILDSQIKNLTKNEQAKLDVLAAHEKLRSRGFIVPLSELSPAEQELVRSNVDSGYVIPWRPVWKSSSISTPCRPVFDASSKTPGGESLNNILAKGINQLATIANSVLRFRSGEGVFTCDVTMAYNGVDLDPSCYRYQQFLWKEDLNPENPVIVMIIKTLIYGVRSSGNQLHAGFEKLAEDTIKKFPELAAGAAVLRDEGYVDDLLHVDVDLEAAHAAADQLEKVLERAGLKAKAYTFVGSPPDEAVSSDGIHVGLVGLLWAPVEDYICLDIKELYFGKSKRGVLPEFVVGDFSDALKRNFTRRNLLGKVAGIFDPIGLTTPVTSRLKLDLHDLCLESLGWDDTVPESYLEKWVQNLHDIQELREVRFRRTVIPHDAASLNIDLVISSDASKSIAVSCVHARVPLRSGGFSCQLYTAKSKIVRYETVPRAELRAAVMSASLGHSVKYNLGSKFCGSMYVTDSTIVLHWLSHDERPLDTAVRNSVIEIRRFTDVNQWYHIDGALNIADLGTRHALVSDIGPGSEWQDGKCWMNLPVSEMPVKTIEEVNLSSEEKRLASQELKHFSMYNEITDLVPKVSERYKFSNYLVDPNKFSWEKSVRIMGYVLKFLTLIKQDWKPIWFPAVPPSSLASAENVNLLGKCCCWSNESETFESESETFESESETFEPEFETFELEVETFEPETGTFEGLEHLNFINLSIPGCRAELVQADVDKAENYFYYKATQEVLKFSPEKDYKETFVVRNGILHYVGRILDSQEICSPEDTMFDLTPLSFVRPIVDRYSPVGYSVMLHSHESISHHKSATASLLESRSLAFILRGRDLATEIVKSCRPCIRFRTKLVEVEMGKLHQSRLTIAPVFYCCQVDLFGPLIAICEHQHRSTVKIYGVVFKDPGSCAVSIHVMQNYSTPAFLQAYTRFAARYGHPTELRIDEGSQLMAACKKMEISIVDIKNNLNAKHQVGVKFSTCPVAGHNAHGMVERSIREIKNLMLKMYKGLKLDILSLETCFAWISSELNNLPICLGSRVDNLDHLDLITPNRLLLGRNNRRALGGFATVSSPSRLIEQMDRVYEVWWKIWKSEKLVDFIPQPNKWRKTNEQLKVGDVVIFLKSDSENRLGEPIWRIARVRSVETSEDGLARSATLEYRNVNEKIMRTTHRSVRSVVVVHRESDLDVIQSLEKAALEAKLDDETE